MALMQTEALQSRVVPVAGGVTYRVMTNLVTLKAVAADTNGAYSLFEEQSEPGQGQPPHFQRYEDKTLWVLEGTYTFWVDGRMIELGVGNYLFIPRGTIHSFINSGVSSALMLVMMTPGGIYEQFFAEIGEPVVNAQIASPAVDIERTIYTAKKYGIEILLGNS